MGKPGRGREGGSRGQRACGCSGYQYEGWEGGRVGAVRVMRLGSVGRGPNSEEGPGHRGRSEDYYSYRPEGWQPPAGRPRHPANRGKGSTMHGHGPLWHGPRCGPPRATLRHLEYRAASLRANCRLPRPAAPQPPLSGAPLSRPPPCAPPQFGNPHSRTHLYGWESEEAVEEARAKVGVVLAGPGTQIGVSVGCGVGETQQGWLLLAKRPREGAHPGLTGKQHRHRTAAGSVFAGRTRRAGMEAGRLQ